jgi:hypothetical protein
LALTGVVKIRERIMRYLAEERVAALEKRCAGPVRAILAASNTAYEEARRVVPEDPDAARCIAEETRRIAFSQWWTRQWTDVRAEVKRFFDERFGGAEPEGLRTLRERYRDEVTSRLKALPARAASRRQAIFDAHSIPVFGEAANVAWREELHAEMRQLVRDVASMLSEDLRGEASALVDEMAKRLFGARGVRDRVLESEEKFQRKVLHGIEALFLRFARPVTDVLVRYPKGSVGRRSHIEQTSIDLDTIDNYVTDVDPAHKNLRKFARYGIDLLNNPVVRTAVLGIAGGTVGAAIKGVVTAGGAMAAAPDREDIAAARARNTAATPEEVIAEVEGDLAAVEVYLTHGIFAAAGIGAYREQELLHLLYEFVRLGDAGVWSAVMDNEQQRGNHLLLGALPIELKDRAFNAEVSERLHQLRLALDAGGLVLRK